MDIIKYYVDQFNINDEEFIKNDIDNEKAYEWMKKEIPLFTCSDKDIERAYYFRCGRIENILSPLTTVL